MPSPMTQLLSKKLAAKLQTMSGARADMHISDSVPVTASSTKILIGFDSRLGHPTAEQITAFVSHKFQGQVDAKLETAEAIASVDGKRSGVAVVVAPLRLTKPISEKEHMTTIVANTLFLDQTIGANWEIRKNADGTEFLECLRGENVNQLLNTVIASQGALHSPLKFGENVTAAVDTSVGDFVEFYTDVGIRRGDVTKVSDDKVTILADDRQWVVDKPSVTRILRLNPKKEDAKRKQIETFYSAIWGPDFAKKLAQTLPTERD